MHAQVLLKNKFPKMKLLDKIVFKLLIKVNIAKLQFKEFYQLTLYKKYEKALQQYFQTVGFLTAQ